MLHKGTPVGSDEQTSLPLVLFGHNHHNGDDNASDNGSSRGDDSIGDL